jgi:hypothetical protein
MLPNGARLARIPLRTAADGAIARQIRLVGNLAASGLPTPLLNWVIWACSRGWPAIAAAGLIDHDARDPVCASGK